MSLNFVLICYTTIVTANLTFRSLVEDQEPINTENKQQDKRTKRVEYLKEGMVNQINTAEKSNKIWEKWILNLINHH